MELELSTNLVQCPGQSGWRAEGHRVNLLKAEREAMRRMLDENYRLFDATFRLVETQQMEANA
jgi:hypothetical protein